MKGFKYISNKVYDIKLGWVYNAFPNGGFNPFPRFKLHDFGVRRINKINI